MKDGQESNATPNAATEITTDATAVAPEPSKLRLFLESIGISWDAAYAIFIGVCAIVCVGLVAMAVRWHKSARLGREEEASRLFLQANSSGAMNEVLSKYGASKIKPVAMLRLAQYQQAEGSLALAKDTYDQFLREFPTHPMISTAELGKIACTESAGSMNDAIVAYDDFIARRPEDSLVSEAVFGKARCMERLGRLDEARQIYEDFIAAHSKSVWKSRAEQALEQIKKEIKRASEEPVQLAPTMSPMVSMPSLAPDQQDLSQVIVSPGPVTMPQQTEVQPAPQDKK